jgi:Nucleotidyl transferase AbiEii toxin, Type IV TA system
MRYSSGADFRRALEERLRTASLASSIPLVRLRKMVAFDRFLARLVTDQPGHWILKGGLAHQLRLGARAQTTNDMDLLSTVHDTSLSLHQSLVSIALIDLGDWFQFQVAQSSLEHRLRFPVQSLLDGRTFETFHVDVGYDDPVLEAPDQLSGPPLLEFADIGPAIVPCYPLSQQIAEKVHAYTRGYLSGESTRIKDWVDILLMAEMGSFHAQLLRRALQATFDARQTHPLPQLLPLAPPEWEQVFRQYNRLMELDIESLADATESIARFIDPILQGEIEGDWDPINWMWK